MDHTEHDSGHHHRHTSVAEKHSHAGHEGMVEDFKRRFLVSVVLSLPVIFLSNPVISWLNVEHSVFNMEWLPYILLGISAVVFTYGGLPFLRGAYVELRARRPGMMTLVAVAVTTAFLYSTAGVLFGLFEETLLMELVTLVDIMLLGHWIEMRSVLGASRALSELAKLLPKVAHKLRFDGAVEDVGIDELRPGDKVLIKPGEKIPVDGSVTRGEGSVSEAMLTGESIPVSKKEGSEVIGGSINGEGSLVVEITKTGKETYLASIIALVEEAGKQKSKTQALADRAASWLTVVALVGGSVTFFAWLGFGREITYAIERAIAVIVIACPHALGLAVPLVASFSSSLSAQRGILIRNRTAFEQLRNVRKIIFDKTGTLTEGKFGISKVIPLDKFSKEEILVLAAAVEAKSEHPIARAIVESVKYHEEVIRFKAIPGKGAEGEVAGRHVAVVSPKYLKELKSKWESEYEQTLIQEAKTAVWVLINMKVAGLILLEDVIRESAREAIDEAKQMGIEPVIISGDNEAVTRRVADELGIIEYHAGVLPKDKAALVEKLKLSDGRTAEDAPYNKVVAMVGDGINDAPALVVADVGMAIGAGMQVAIEAADLVLVKNNPLDVLRAVRLSRATYKKMVQNLWWASGYNILAIPLAAGILAPFGFVLSPAVGAVLMSVSTVVVVYNATLLKRDFV